MVEIGVIFVKSLWTLYIVLNMVGSARNGAVLLKHLKACMGSESWNYQETVKNTCLHFSYGVFFHTVILYWMWS